jgi:hypothetical protein
MKYSFAALAFASLLSAERAFAQPSAVEQIGTLATGSAR